MRILFDLFIFAFLFSESRAVSCGPPNCAASCGGTCSFSLCTGSATRLVEVAQLPFTYHWTSDTCDDSIDDNSQYFHLPLSIGGRQITAMRTSFSHSYRTCSPRSFTAPPCLNFSASGNSSSMNLSLSITGGVASRGTQSFSGSCGYGGQSMDWGWPVGKTGDSYSGPSTPGPERSGCTATYCVWASGPGGEVGPVCGSMSF